MNLLHLHLRSTGALLCAAALLSGCAAPNGQPGSNATTGAAAGAGIGAVAGLIACKALRGSDSTCIKTAAALGAAGGFIGWRAGREKDIQQAQALANAMRGTGAVVKTEVVPVSHSNDSGQQESVNVWKGTTVGLPANLLNQRSPDIQRSVQLSGQLAAARAEPSRVLVSVPDKDRAIVQSWLQRGLQERRPGGSPPAIVMLQPRAGDVPFIRVEPLDPAQYGLAQSVGTAG